MATLKLNLARLNPGQLVELADTVLAKMDPAQPEPPAPPIPPAIAGLEAETASMKTKRDAAFAAKKAYDDAYTGLPVLKAARDAAADELRIEHTAYAAAISAKAKGDPVILAAPGYPLAADKVVSSDPPAQVTNLSLTQGDMDGSLDGSHDPAARAASYEVQLTTVDPVAGPYTTVLQPTGSRWSLDGLTSGQRVWVRVRGIGSNGAGPWSDPATKIVP